MSEFVNTIDLLGDDVVMDSIIDRSITEFKDNVVKSIGRGAFYECTELTNVDVPKATILDYETFYNCYSLKKIDSGAQKIDTKVFWQCYSLIAVILRSETLCTIGNAVNFTNCYHFYGTVNATYNPDGLQDGYVYVPSALIEEYKVATNWATLYASHPNVFRALEDYTVDGTITGELDESKI